MSAVFQRHIDIPGLINFRDLGQYPARDLAGRLRSVKPGMLFRAGHFHDADTAANAVLAQLHIQMVFDFRSAAERKKKPNHLRLLPAPTTIELDLDPGSGASFLQALPAIRSANTIMDAAVMEQMMCQINRSLVTDHAPVYREFFRLLRLHKPSAVVMHCASGKDRTGVAAALLLSALGVDCNTVIEDYLLTNSCLDVNHHVARAIADFDDRYQSIMNPEALTAMYEVRPSYLAAALDEIDNRFGGMPQYLAGQMGLDQASLEQLQQDYLDP